MSQLFIFLYIVHVCVVGIGNPAVSNTRRFAAKISDDLGTSPRPRAHRTPSKHSGTGSQNVTKPPATEREGALRVEGC